MAGSPLQPSVDTVRQGAPDPREELRRVLAAMSAAWQGRRYDSLAQVFADNMVVALPASSARLEGARAIVESYRANREAGHDVFVFRRDPSAPWRAVWRTMSFEPSAQKPHTPAS